MRPVIIGLVAAAAAGASLGVASEWLATSGGWDGEEMRLGIQAARGAGWFVSASLIAEVVRRLAGYGAGFAVPATCLLGAALFGSIGFMDDGRFEVEPGRVFLFTILSLPLMAGVFVIGDAMTKSVERKPTAVR